MTFDLNVTRRLFLGLLGLVYAFAFASLFVQVDGLVGANGVLPAGSFLAAQEQALQQEAAGARNDAPGGLDLFLELPTLCWLGTSDAFLRGICALGIALAALLVLGIAPILLLPALWLLYLSLTNIGQDFLSFQWDTLLLETGWFAIWLAPAGMWPRGSAVRPPTLVATWALRLLFLRFMFGSGIVKLQSGDPVWRDGTALLYHYFTQPLPSVFGWFAHQMPLAAHQFCARAMFVVELGLPWLIFVGWRTRRLVAFVTIELLILIGAAGNYGFFEPLALALALFLFARPAMPAVGATVTPTIARVGRIVTATIAGGSALIGLLIFAFQIARRPLGPEWLKRFEQETALPWIQRTLAPTWRQIAPFHTINTYGLFADMTTERPELVIEGSDDLATWKPYEFRWKPGDLQRAPVWCTPHMPRLDWQMWFAALDRQPPAWFRPFLQRLLVNEPAVTRLLATNPFPDRPPTFLRAVLFDYRFTTQEERSATQAWWKRKELRIYQTPIRR